jgi:riboflavin synthase
MFTGIISSIGTVKAISDVGTTRTLTISSDFDAEGILKGASIAHEGVCLTLISAKGHDYVIEASLETIEKTTLGDWKIGTELNLERALKVGDELGGHWVSGHIDDVALISQQSEKDGTVLWHFTPPPRLMPYIAEKGSVALNGTSLTVNSVSDSDFTVTMIPHTLQVTTWGKSRVGDRVNIEIDLMARYAARLMQKL